MAIAQSSALDLALFPSITLATAEVSARRQTLLEPVSMSRLEVPVEQLARAPQLLGEADLIKALLLLPGVTAGAEGTAGLYVRGGSPDQNLILLDGVPLYQVSHVLGIFSVFSPDAVQHVALTTGGFPARFGGRLSSVLEVDTREGSREGWGGTIGIGLLSSRATVSGPLGSRARLMVSGRRSYADLLLWPATHLGRNARNRPTELRFHFADLYAKATVDIAPRHTLYLTGYNGVDRFSQVDITRARLDNDLSSRYSEGVDWGNTLGAARWRATLGPRAFVNTQVSASRYGIGFANESTSTFREQTFRSGAVYESRVRDLNFRSDLTWAVGAQHYLRAGAGLTDHAFRPGALQRIESGGATSLDTVLNLTTLRSLEGYAYVEDEWNISRSLAANLGLHASAFRATGTDEPIYTSLQPRASLRWRTGARGSIRASYAEMTQYVHLLTSETLSLPTDLWLPTGDGIRPQRARQAALGYSHDFGSGHSLNVEAYGKRLREVVSYRAGASFFDFDPAVGFAEKVVQGRGEVYGLELLARRDAGRLQGWLAYTLSRNTRQFPDINGGRVFPFRYDRRHDVSVYASYGLRPGLALTATWVAYSGNAYTFGDYTQNLNFALPEAGTVPQNENVVSRLRFAPVTLADVRNNRRVSPTHRLDLGVAFTKAKTRGERTWSFGLYNAYWRRNPWYVRERQFADPVTGELRRKLQEVTLLPILPSVSYSFTWQSRTS